MNVRFQLTVLWCWVAHLLSCPAVVWSHTNQGTYPAVDVQQSTAIDFIENLGQWTEAARYKAEIPGGVMFLTEAGIVYNFVSFDDLNKWHVCGSMEQSHDLVDEVVRFHSYNVRFLGGRSDRFEPFDRKPYYHNYFFGRDSSRWKGKVGVFGGVAQREVYPGIDFVLYGAQNNSVKYDFVVAPGSDPGQIRLSFEGVTPRIASNGDLIIQTSVNEVRELAPYTYQWIDGKKVTVLSEYKLDADGTLSFQFPNGFDAGLPLVIDPNLVFSTYSGAGFGPKYAHSTAYDNDGNAYIAVLSTDPGWPVTTGAYQIAFPGLEWTTAMSKLNSDGSQLLFGTFFGGSGVGNTQPNTLRINNEGEIVLAGNTTNANLPVTPGAYQQSLRGSSDIYIAKFSGDGSTLLACTYVGGSNREALMIGFSVNYVSIGDSENPINPVDVAFDDEGNVWVTSNTESQDFPVTANAYQRNFSDWQDAVLFQLSSDLSVMRYGTFFGGDRWDGGIGIEFHPITNRIVVAGFTQSEQLPTTSAAYKPLHGGKADGFAIVVDAANYQIVSASYIGTSEDDIAMRVSFDCSGNIYIAGRTSGDYPITTTAADGAVVNGPVFIHKFDPDLSISLASTRTGTNTWTAVPTALMVDKCGNILVAVIAGGLHIGAPVTPDAIQSDPRRLYFAAFKPQFKGLLFATFFGSLEDDHYHPGVARMDPDGVVYQSVCAATQAFPVTPGSYAPAKMNGLSMVDNISFKFDYDLHHAVDVDIKTGGGANEPRIHTVRGCLPAVLHFTRNTSPSEPEVVRLIIEGDAENGRDYEFIADSIVIPPGQMSASLNVKGLLLTQASEPNPKHVVITTLKPCFCSESYEDDIVSRDTVWIYDSLYVKMLTPPDTTCPGAVAIIEAEIDTTLNYAWTPVSMIVDPHTTKIETRAINRNTTFGITVFQPGAPATCPPRTARYHHVIEPYPKLKLPNPEPICLVDSLALTIYAQPDSIDLTYRWSPSEGLRNDHAPDNKFFAVPGVYVKKVSATTAVAGCTSIDSFEIHIIDPAGFSRLSSDTTIHYGDTIQLYAELTGGGQIAWAPIHVIVSMSDHTAPLVSPLVPTRFTISGLDHFGCLNVEDIFVDVVHHSIADLPDAFTPNGDGKNDVFRLVNRKFEKLLEFKVFNRYGQLVFQTTDVREGWDGTFNGTHADVGVYFYFVSFVLPDGQHKQIQGDVTLIR